MNRQNGYARRSPRLIKSLLHAPFCVHVRPTACGRDARPRGQQTRGRAQAAGIKCLSQLSASVPSAYTSATATDSRPIEVPRALHPFRPVEPIGQRIGRFCRHLLTHLEAGAIRGNRLWLPLNPAKPLDASKHAFALCRCVCGNVVARNKQQPAIRPR